MGLKAILSGVMSGLLPLVSSGNVPGKVTAKYEQFKDVTTITVIGQQVKGEPVLHAWSSFSGRKPGPFVDAELGFLVRAGCPFPNFLADGKRIEPLEAGAAPGVVVEQVTNNRGDEQQYEFVFSFFDPQHIKQIATAKSVQYEICNKVRTLAPEDQGYLRQFLSYYPDNNSAKSSNCVANNNLGEVTGKSIDRCRSASLKPFFSKELLSEKLANIKNGLSAKERAAWRMLNQQVYFKPNSSSE